MSKKFVIIARQGCLPLNTPLPTVCMRTRHMLVVCVRTQPKRRVALMTAERLGFYPSSVRELSTVCLWAVLRDPPLHTSVEYGRDVWGDSSLIYPPWYQTCSPVPSKEMGPFLRGSDIFISLVTKKPDMFLKCTPHLKRWEFRFWGKTSKKGRHPAEKWGGALGPRTGRGWRNWSSCCWAPGNWSRRKWAPWTCNQTGFCEY